MSATEELRKLLDENGVEWGNVRNDGSESDYLTEWQFEDNQGKAIAIEWAVGSGLSVETHRYHLTPKQAIAATLGPAYEPPVAAHWDGDTLTLTIPRDPSCIRVQRSAEQPCKVYADESKVIAATLGRGTCHDMGGCRWFRCSACGFGIEDMYVSDEDEYPPAEQPRYCPNCGRLVVEVDR